MTKREKLLGLRPFVLQQVIGQEDAVLKVCLAVQGQEFNLNDRGSRPKGAFLFMGPSGVGKTQSAKALSEHLFGPGKLSMVFMNQFQDARSASGFVEELTRIQNACPTGGVLLCDEIEKATRETTDVLLSVLDEGQVALNDGSRVSLNGFYFVLTSNLGSSDFSQMEHTPFSTLERFAFSKARERLRPEFFTRLTETVVYRPLSVETQVAILDPLISHKLECLQAAFLMELGPRVPRFTADEASVRPHLLNRAFSKDGGARQLREELNRQFNAACLPFLLEGTSPKEGRFYGVPAENKLVLK